MTGDGPPNLEELLRHERWLRGLVRGLVQPDDVDDVLQQTWIAALEQPPRSRTAARSWLERVAGNLARNRLRHARRHQRHERAAPPAGDAPSTAEVVERLALQRRVTAAVMELDEPFRTAVFLRYYEGLSADEIAQRTGTTADNARQRVHRGLARLRTTLERDLGPEWRHSSAVLALLRPAQQGVPALAAGAALIAFGAFLAWQAWGLLAPAASPAAPVELARGEGASDARDPVRPTGVEPQREVRVPAPSDRLQVLARFADGSPAAGVAVAVRPASDRSWLREQWRVADAYGRAEFTAPPAGALEVRAARAGLVRVPADARPAVVELALPTGLAVDGVVRDRHGAPAAGARIWVAEPERGLDEGAVVATTDADGRFWLRDVAPGRLCGVLADRDAAPPAVVVAGEPGAVVAVELTLRGQAGTVRGVVRGADGGPLGDAAVLAGWSLPFHDTPLPPPARQRTDEDGRFTVPVPPDLHVPLWVGAAGHAPFATTVTVASSEVLELEIRLGRGARLSGVVRSGDGQPLAGAAIEVVPAATDLRHEGRSIAPGFALADTATTEDGTFALADLPAGDVVVVAQHGGFTALERIALAEGAAHEVHPLLGAPAAIHGRLVDAHGRGVAGLEVTATAPDREPRAVHSDAEGRFRIDGCLPAPHRLTVRQADCDLAAGVLVDASARPSAAPGEWNVPEAVHAAGWLTGALRCADGSPPVSAQLALIQCEDGTERLAGRRAAGSDGRFRLGPLPPGEWEIVATSPATGMRSLGRFVLRPGEERDVGTQPFEVPGALDVRVLDPDGAPAGVAFVMVRRPGEVANASVRLSAGRGQRAAMQPGRWYALVWNRSVPPAWREFTIAPGATTEVELRLERGIACCLRFPAVERHGVVLTMTLRDEHGGVALQQTLIRPTDAGDGGRLLQTSCFRPGVWELELATRAGATAVTRFEVGDGDPTRVVDVLLPR